MGESAGLPLGEFLSALQKNEPKALKSLRRAQNRTPTRHGQ
jgi:hypothetical protein